MGTPLPKEVDSSTPTKDPEDIPTFDEWKKKMMEVEIEKSEGVLAACLLCAVPHSSDISAHQPPHYAAVVGLSCFSILYTAWWCSCVMHRPTVMHHHMPSVLTVDNIYLLLGHWLYSQHAHTHTLILLDQCCDHNSCYMFWLGYSMLYHTLIAFIRVLLDTS